MITYKCDKDVRFGRSSDICVSARSIVAYKMLFLKYSGFTSKDDFSALDWALGFETRGVCMASVDGTHPWSRKEIEPEVRTFLKLFPFIAGVCWGSPSASCFSTRTLPSWSSTCFAVLNTPNKYTATQSSRAEDMIKWNTENKVLQAVVHTTHSES